MTEFITEPDQQLFYYPGAISGTTNIVHYKGEVKHTHYNIPEHLLDECVAEISRLYFSS